VGAGAVALTDVNGIVLGDIDAGSLDVIARAGAITDDGVGNALNADVDVSGQTNLMATGNIVLDDSGNNFSSVDANAADVTLTDVDALILGVVTASNLRVPISR